MLSIHENILESASTFGVSMFACAGYGTRFFKSKREWGWERFRIVSNSTEVHGIHSPVSNKENMNDVGTTVGPTPTGNTHGMSSYANVTVAPSRKALNFLFIYTRGNEVDVVVLVESIRAISEWFANTAYVFFLGKRVAYPVVANYVRNTWGKYELVKSMLNSSTGIFSFQFSSMHGLDAMLKNEDVVNVPVWVKLHGVLVTAFSEDGLSAIATKLALIEVRVDVELKDNIVVAMPKLVGGRDSIRVLFVLSMSGNLPGVRVVSKKNNVNTSGNKKKDMDVEPTIEVSNSNPFDVLNSVENDVDLGINCGTSNLASNEANSGGSSFWNVEASITNTTPIVDKIDKYEKLIIDGKVSLMDDEGKPLKKVAYPDDHDSEDEVESVDNDMTRFMASERVGFGTNSLLEQWRDTYENADYNYAHTMMIFDNDMTRFMASERVGFGTNSLLEQWRDTYENADYNYAHTMMIFDGNGEPSAYEVLKSYNLPIGVLPKGALGYTLDHIVIGLLPMGVAGYTLDPNSGQFSVNVMNGCDLYEGGYQIKYDPTITSIITQNKLGGKDGVKVKRRNLTLGGIEVRGVARAARWGLSMSETTRTILPEYALGGARGLPCSNSLAYDSTRRSSSVLTAFYSVRLEMSY
ncbi:retrotransposon protein, putative, unclassified [Tanacetum coccineum]|uniref:Retrotransposon protein, putative, unclassified n=1 Tax=Tanacetum coccineum TaxID=301880 RepID=A0ABQ5HS02_9ASTR